MVSLDSMLLNLKNVWTRPMQHVEAYEFNMYIYILNKIILNKNIDKIMSTYLTHEELYN